MVGKSQENSYAHDVCMCVQKDNNAHDVLVCGWENNNVILHARVMFLCACGKITRALMCIVMLLMILLPSNSL